MSDEKYSIKDVARYVNSEGLGYAIQYGLGADSIENLPHAVLWVQAKAVLDAITEILPDEDELYEEAHR